MQREGDDGKHRGLPVTSLINIGIEAAFHGAPATGIAPLMRAIDQATSLAEHAQARWLLGVCLASLGRFDEAREVLDPLLTSAVVGTHWRALAHTTVASTLRQQSQHIGAQAHDEQALAVADEVTTFDAHIGLAADAVGQLDLQTAREHWARAMSSATPEWRQQVRLAWVEAEIALMRNRPAQALKVSQVAAETSKLAQAPRHRAKSLLFAGVAAKVAGDVSLANALLAESLATSEELGLLPLQQPAREMLKAI